MSRTKPTSAPTATASLPKLSLKFHGRIIDSLGIQMYQSPVDAIAELIANAWDADATSVQVTLPDHLGETAEIVIADDGLGMTLKDCQDLYLNVGRNRRTVGGNASPDGRPVLGRKGIGKFAGFGIAELMYIETVSKETGERTVFGLDLNQLRSEEYVSTDEKPVAVVSYDPPSPDRISKHGTVVRLQRLKLTQRRNPEAFAKSMARRFSLAQQSAQFKVTVSGFDLPKDVEPFKVQFEFPSEYEPDERPVDLKIEQGWGKETLADGNEIIWRVRFSEKPIDTEEFRGISVFCGVKLAQRPFFFELSGGLAGQHGEQYLTGSIRADYLDQYTTDLITTERQRINWEDSHAAALKSWGQQRIKELLALWQKRRAQKKLDQIDEKIAGFGARLARQQPHEQKIIRGALQKLAAIESLEDDRFHELADAVLTAWEGGRLRRLVEDIANIGTMDAGVLLTLLGEERILTALHTAEIVEIRVSIIRGMRERVARREKENDIRDYIAQHPWLISPEWETFKRETSLKKFIDDALKTSGITGDPKWAGRMDLVLRSGRHLLVIEFMRPGLTVDWDHLSRFELYVNTLRTQVEANSNLDIRDVTGLLVADKLSKDAAFMKKIASMRREDMLAEEWEGLLARAQAQWLEFMSVLKDRAPDDLRLEELERRTEESSKPVDLKRK